MWLNDGCLASENRPLAYLAGVEGRQGKESHLKERYLSLTNSMQPQTHLYVVQPLEQTGDKVRHGTLLDRQGRQ